MRPRESILTAGLALAAWIVACPIASAQKAPEVGYVFPAGGRAGTTVNVQLGGYDWTPDMDYFVHDRRVQLVASSAPGPILIPPPPYWFGAKGRLPAMPLPREVPARIVIPTDVPAGPIYWQAANANGCTSVGVFVVGSGTEVVEDERRRSAQPLPGLPVTVSGRLFKNEEVDAYRFKAPRDGPISCELMARRLGAKFHGVLEIRDTAGQMVADVAGTNGTDPSITFVAKGGAEYTVHVRDIDFGGDRSYVYRLTITDGPHVVGTLPAAGRRGETRDVEFIGIGVASGAPKLESVKRRVAFPAAGSSAEYRLETPFGAAAPFAIELSDLPEVVARPGELGRAGPVAITGVLDLPDAEHRHTFTWKKGDTWSLSLQARRIGSPLDVALALLGPDGKELARNDDLPETTDAGLDFTVPADGAYCVVVSDMAGKSGSPASIYRLVVQQPPADFSLQLATQRIGVPIAGKFDLGVKAVRTGGSKGAIALTVSGLPPGVSAGPNLIIPADKSDLTLSLQASKDAPAVASLVTVAGTATIDGKAVSRSAVAPITANRAPRCPEENRLPAVMIASTLKPLFKGRPFDQDTGRKVPRGSTFPAEVIVERLDGFGGEIVLQMGAQQSYQVQGISGGEVVVPPGVKETLYPCYMPEWLETTRTSRLGMVGVAKAADPTGKVRYQLNEITGFVTMTMEGALLKVSAEDRELVVPAGKPFDVRLKVARLVKLAEPVRLELHLPDELDGQFRAQPIVLAVGKEDAVLRVTPAASLAGLHTINVRATALQHGKYLAVSETQVSVELMASVQAPR
jgi:hypothetical protein